MVRSNQSCEVAAWSLPTQHKYPSGPALLFGHAYPEHDTHTQEGKDVERMLLLFFGDGEGWRGMSEPRAFSYIPSPFSLFIFIVRQGLAYFPSLDSNLCSS